MFLCGKFTTAVDSKNRVRLPAKLKSELGDKYILMPGMEGCIYVVREDQPQVILNILSGSESVDPAKEKILRELLSQCSSVDADVQGRFTLPTNLIQYAGITGEIEIVGNVTKAEIWATDRWNSNNTVATPQSITELYSALNSANNN